ncbi:MAG: acyl-CoA thioesterase [Burkholderiaceae bacterium]
MTEPCPQGIDPSLARANIAPEGLPPTEQPALRLVTTPADASYSGKILGGWIMTQVDVAGSVPAVKRANGPVATVGVSSFNFDAPVFVGDLLSLYARVVRTGETSITVDMEAYAQRLPDYQACVRVAQATLIYVALGRNDRPRALQPS